MTATPKHRWYQFSLKTLLVGMTEAGLVHLAEIKNLTYVRLDNTLVTDAGVAELQKALPNCKIIR